MTDKSKLEDNQDDKNSEEKESEQRNSSSPEDCLTDPKSDNSISEKESIRKIEEKIEDIEPDLLVDLPSQKRQQLLSFAMKVSKHSGPLPDPDSMRKYNEIVPGLADRMVAMVEKEGEHRRSEQAKDGEHRRQMESKVVKEGLNFPERGQWIGLGIAIFVISIGSYLILHGFPDHGTLIITTIVVALVGIFVLGKYMKKDGESENESDD